MLGVDSPTVKVPDTELCPHYTLRVARGGCAADPLHIPQQSEHGHFTLVRATNTIIIVIIAIKNLHLLSGHPSAVVLQVTLIGTVQSIHKVLG